MSFQGFFHAMNAFWSAIKDNKTLWVQIPIAFCALCIAAAAISFAVVTLRQERNASLVRIGVSVLRADPKKEPSAAAARVWALDLIDPNAGGVRFSKEAREELLTQALAAKPIVGYEIGGFSGGDVGGFTGGDVGGFQPKNK
jgi:hypothetical protein